jgi:hypothetical protein
VSSPSSSPIHFLATPPDSSPAHLGQKEHFNASQSAELVSSQLRYLATDARVREPITFAKFAHQFGTESGSPPSARYWPALEYEEKNLPWLCTDMKRASSSGCNDFGCATVSSPRSLEVERHKDFPRQATGIETSHGLICYPAVSKPQIQSVDIAFSASLIGRDETEPEVSYCMRF